MNNRVYIHLTKGSGGSLLDVKIEGYQVQNNIISIAKIATNQKFRDDVERLRFAEGQNASLAAISDFFMVERAFDTGNVTIDNNSPVSLSTYAQPSNMNVKGNGVTIADGDSSPSTSDFTDFGSQAASSGSVTKTFTIENIGGGTLVLSGSPLVAVSGTNAADFVVSLQPQPIIPPGSSTTFQITFDPSATGSRSASLSIANNDPGSNKNPYNFSISGTGA